MNRLFTPILVCLVAIWSACASPVKLQVLKAASSSNAPRIVVLASVKQELLAEPLQAIKDSLSAELLLVAVDRSTDEEQLAALVTGSKPSLLFAFGARAAVLAAEKFPTTPLLFAMVVDHRG